MHGIDYSKSPYVKNDCGDNVQRGYIAHLHLSTAQAVLGTTTFVKTAVTSGATPSVITTGLTSPVYPRNVTATAGGTAGDIKAIQVVVEGTNENNEVITETLPAFTVDTAGTVVGSKIFKTITKVTIPAHDGTGATTAIGTGDKLGIGFKLAHNTVLSAYLNNTKESTAPTVAVSSTAQESNSITLNSALNGTVVDAYFIV